MQEIYLNNIFFQSLGKHCVVFNCFEDLDYKVKLTYSCKNTVQIKEIIYWVKEQEKILEIH